MLFHRAVNYFYKFRGYFQCIAGYVTFGRTGLICKKTLPGLLNVSQTTYSRYETGALDLPSQVLITLAVYYHTSVDYILGLTDKLEPYPRRPKLRS